MSSSSGVGP